MVKPESYREPTACPACGYENPGGVRFCGNCRTPIRSTECRDCGAAVRDTDRYCPWCGADQSARSGERRESMRLGTGLVPDAALATARTERKFATILFADIVDSTRMTYGRELEEAVDRLKPAIEAMSNAVAAYQGVFQSVGDGIKAIFGVPTAHEDHGVRGCYAALDILDAVSRLNGRAREERGEFVQVRIGLHSGEVLLEASELGAEAYGPSIALAERMQRLAQPGTAMMTRETLNLAKGFVRASGEGTARVRGVDAPVEVYALEGATAPRTRFHAVVSRGLSQFVGRAREMETLSRAARTTCDGRGQIVAFVGEVGVGKSRIAWEFTRSHETTGWLVLESSSVSYGRATPYLPLISLLRGYFDIGPRDDERRIHERINGKLLTLDSSLLDSKHVLLGLLGLARDVPKWEAMSPAQRRRDIIDMVIRIVVRESQEQPVCIVFEDLHWMDQESEACLGALVDAIGASRALILINYRPDYECRWTSRTNFIHSRVDPLPPEFSGQLLDALLGPARGLSLIKERLIAATEGNPFFIEESVRALVETGVVAGEKGGYRAVRSPKSLDVPATVQAVVSARIDRLDALQKGVLQRASVIGKDFGLNVLREIVNLDDQLLSDSLAHLQSSEFVYQTSLYPLVRFTFKHAVTHQVAYQEMARSQRREIHLKVLAALESLYAHEESRPYERMAHHAFEGEAWDQAVTYLEQAGRLAYEKSANADAVRFLERALEALGHLPDVRGRIERGVDLRFALRQALISLGEVRRIGIVLEAAQPLVEALRDPGREARLHAFISNDAYLGASPRKAIEHAKRSLALAEQAEDVDLQVELCFRLGQAQYSAGEFDASISSLERGLRIIESAGASPGDADLRRFGVTALPSVICRAWLAHCHAERGQDDRALDCAEAAQRIASRAGHPLTSVFGAWGAGFALLRAAQVHEAARVLEHGLEICNRWSVVVWYPRLASLLAHAWADCGRPREAVDLGRRAVAEAESIGFVLDQSALHERLGRALLADGQPDDAAREAARAAELAEAHEQPALLVWALDLEARVSEARGDGDAAGRARTRARERARALGMRAPS